MFDWLRRLKRFFHGEYACIHCGKKWYAFNGFGIGKMICPECYRGEKVWLFPEPIFE